MEDLISTLITKLDKTPLSININSINEYSGYLKLSYKYPDYVYINPDIIQNKIFQSKWDTNTFFSYKFVDDYKLEGQYDTVYHDFTYNIYKNTDFYDNNLNTDIINLILSKLSKHGAQTFMDYLYYDKEKIDNIYKYLININYKNLSKYIDNNYFDYFYLLKDNNIKNMNDIIKYINTIYLSEYDENDDDIQMISDIYINMYPNILKVFKDYDIFYDSSYLALHLLENQEMYNMYGGNLIKFYSTNISEFGLSIFTIYNTDNERIWANLLLPYFIYNLNTSILNELYIPKIYNILILLYIVEAEDDTYGKLLEPYLNKLKKENYNLYEELENFGFDSINDPRLENYYIYEEDMDVKDIISQTTMFFDRFNEHINYLIQH